MNADSWFYIACGTVACTYFICNTITDYRRIRDIAYMNTINRIRRWQAAEPDAYKRSVAQEMIDELGG